MATWRDSQSACCVTQQSTGGVQKTLQGLRLQCCLVSGKDFKNLGQRRIDESRRGEREGATEWSGREGRGECVRQVMEQQEGGGVRNFPGCLSRPDSRDVAGCRLAGASQTLESLRSSAPFQGHSSARVVLVLGGVRPREGFHLARGPAAPQASVAYLWANQPTSQPVWRISNESKGQHVTQRQAHKGVR